MLRLVWLAPVSFVKPSKQNGYNSPKNNHPFQSHNNERGCETTSNFTGTGREQSHDGNKRHHEMQTSQRNRQNAILGQKEGKLLIQLTLVAIALNQVVSISET